MCPSHTDNPTLSGFLQDFLRAFYSPKRLYFDLARNPKSGSWFCVLIYSLVYVAGSLWLYYYGFTPFVEPWITLTPERYYLVQAFYILPLVYLMWILGTGVLHLLSQLFGGRGRFETVFNMTGYALWAPWYPLIVVDCIHATPDWVYNVVSGGCLVLVLRGTTIAVMIAEQIRWMAAIFSAVVAVSSIGLILFTYIR